MRSKGTWLHSSSTGTLLSKHLPVPSSAQDPSSIKRSFTPRLSYRLHSNMRRLTSSPLASCSLWPLFGDSFQRRRELTPWRCLFWCSHKSLQMKRWDEWSQGFPVSCWCPRTCCVAFPWGTIHLGRWLTESCCYPLKSYFVLRSLKKSALWIDSCVHSSTVFFSHPSTEGGLFTKACE